MKSNNKNLFTQKQLIRQINQQTRRTRKLLEILTGATSVSILGDRYGKEYKR